MNKIGQVFFGERESRKCEGMREKYKQITFQNFTGERFIHYKMGPKEAFSPRENRKHWLATEVKGQENCTFNLVCQSLRTMSTVKQTSLVIIKGYARQMIAYITTGLHRRNK